MEKLDPALQAWLASPSPEARASGAQDTDTLEVIIRCDRPEDLRTTDIVITSQFGSLITARVTRPQLRYLLGVPSVRFIEKGSINYPQRPKNP